MKKAIEISLKLVSILSAIVILIASFSLFSFADTGTVYTMPLNQPSTDPGRGYLEYLIKTPDGTINPVSLFWNIFPTDPDDSMFNYAVDVEFVNARTLRLYPRRVNSTSFSFSFHYAAVYGNGTANFYVKSFSSTGDRYLDITLASGYSFIGYHAYGSIIDVNVASGLSFNNKFSFLYAENAPEYENLLLLHQDLVAIKSALQNSSGDTIVSLLKSIDNVLDVLGQNVVDIENATRTINQNVLFILQNIDDVEEELRKISGYVDSLEGYVDGIEAYLSTIIASTDDLEGNTQEIIDLLNELLNMYQGGEKPEPPPPVDSDDAENQMGQIDDFVEGENSQNIQVELDNVFDSDNLNQGLDTDTSGFLWDVLQRILDGSPEVMGMLISLLSYGLISLLLGR